MELPLAVTGDAGAREGEAGKEARFDSFASIIASFAIISVKVGDVVAADFDHGFPFGRRLGVISPGGFSPAPDTATSAAASSFTPRNFRPCRSGRLLCCCGDGPERDDECGGAARSSVKAAARRSSSMMTENAVGATGSDCSGDAKFAKFRPPTRSCGGTYFGDGEEADKSLSSDESTMKDVFGLMDVRGGAEAAVPFLGDPIIRGEEPSPDPFCILWSKFRS